MMSVFAWGSCNNGQLGLGGIEEERMLVPKQLQLKDINKRVKDVQCGVDHTLLMLVNGHVYSCGSNEFGQLGRDGPCKRFQRVATLDKHEIIGIACGSHFNLCLTSKHQVFSWGCNDHGQLGRDGNDNSVKLIKQLPPNIVQIACGSHHSVCLTSQSEVVTWGSNRFGELGLGLRQIKKQVVPTKIVSLQGVAVRQLMCGSKHTVCLTVSSGLFCWGQNDFGQLGLGDTKDRFVPSQCRSLRTQPVIHVSCGEAHTAILTRDGGVFTCGSGGCGQLGHNNRNNVLVPTKIFEFMGRDISQVVCGRRHTMALIVSTGRLMTFGLGANGQLGVGHTSDLLTPAPMKGPWIPLLSSTGIYERRLSIPDVTDPRVIFKAFAGHGDSCFILSDSVSDGILPIDQRDTSRDLLINCLTNSDRSLLLNSKDKATIENIVKRMCDFLLSVALASVSFLNEDHFNVTSRKLGVNLDHCSDIFEGLRNTISPELMKKLRDTVVKLTIALRQKNFPSPECLRVFLIVLQMFSIFPESERDEICFLYCKALKVLDSVPKTYILVWLSIVPLRFLRKLVQQMKNCVLSRIRTATRSTASSSRQSLADPISCDNLWICLDSFGLLFKANQKRETCIGRDVFYINELSDILDVSAEYYHWMTRNNHPNQKSLCQYPFIFDGVAKSLILQADAKLQMTRAVHKAQFSGFAALFNQAMAFELPVLVFKINRESILADTVTNLDMTDSSELKKPLRVIFIGEEAQDEGGVRKEYFMLFFRELMNPNYAMFKHYEDSRTLWFHEHTFEDPRRFALVGTMCGLSIYNNSLVNLMFPLALYKKLLSKPITLDDLKELDPVLGKSLQSLLDYEELDFEDVFCLTFSIESEFLGEHMTTELKPNGKNTAVTSATREEYVNLYIDYIFDKSCENQYKAFHNAFHAVFVNNNDSILSLFEPAELQTLLVGNDEYDWSILQKNTTYKGEFWSNHPVIVWFWETFHEFSDLERKSFLLFLTGSDRVPMQGMETIKIFIQPNNAGDEFLPVAHTCFNLLDLPKYSSKAILSSKLRLAIEQTEGFGLI